MCVCCVRGGEERECECEVAGGCVKTKTLHSDAGNNQQRDVD